MNAGGPELFFKVKGKISMKILMPTKMTSIKMSQTFNDFERYSL